MIYVFFAAVIMILMFFSVFIYWKAAEILKSVDKMLDSAVDGTFSESDFTENRLSRLEAKMYRYLAAGKTERGRIIDERNTVKTLVSDISHQTKTPVSNILIYTQLLNESDGLNDNVRELLYQIENQTNKLSFLIQSLVKTSRLENGIVTVVPEENSIADIFKAIDFTAAVNRRDIGLVLDIPDLIAEFDIKWTSEAISNIIDNAIKYTPSHGTIAVSAKEYEMFVRIDIEDTGIGIKEEETAKIFTRFYRSPAVSSEEGVGIGLYLTRKIIEKEGGYIKVCSQLGKGSVFSVFLPKKSNLSKL